MLPEEFFCIVIWKANRAKTNIKKKLLKIGDGSIQEVTKELTGDIFEAKSKEDKLKILLGKWKFYLPMASAILTVLYPKDFTVYDIRVRSQVGLKEIYSVRKYFSDFLPKIKKISIDRKQDMRNTDRNLWGESFYNDLKKLIEE